MAAEKTFDEGVRPMLLSEALHLFLREIDRYRWRIR